MNQAESDLFEVAYPSVDHFRGGAGGPSGEVALVKEGHGISPHDRVPRYSRSVDAAPDDDDL